MNPNSAVIVIVNGHADSERASAHHHLCSPPADRGARQGYTTDDSRATLLLLTEISRAREQKGSVFIYVYYVLSRVSYNP